jgi:heme/copper-type cytochrome/quinol oxidase subunit 3
MSELVVPTVRRGKPLGWWGMAMLVAAESALFAMLVGTYFYLRFKNLDWPPRGISAPNVVTPLVLLAALVAASGPMWLAVRAGSTGRLPAARGFLVLALAVQAGVFAMDVHEYAGDLSRFRPSDHAYASIYYVLLGAAHAHVGAGLLFDVWLLGKLARGLTPYRLNALHAIALYWYAVDVIAAVVTLTIISAAL